MSILGNSQGTKRTVVFAKESSFGTKAAPTGAKIMPRVETSLNTNFESYQSEEIRDDLQRSASVIGFEKVEGDIKGELAAGQWAAFLRLHYVVHLPLRRKSRLLPKPQTAPARKTVKF